MVFLYMDNKSPKTKRLGDLLVEDDIITQAQLETALDIQKKQGGLIGGIMIKMKIIDPPTLIKYLARGKTKPKLGELMIALGKIKPDQLEKALEYQKENKDEKIGMIMIKMGYIEKSDLVNILLMQSKLLTDEMSSIMEEIDKESKFLGGRK